MQIEPQTLEKFTPVQYSALLRHPYLDNLSDDAKDVLNEFYGSEHLKRSRPKEVVSPYPKWDLTGGRANNKFIKKYVMSKHMYHNL
jgi:hypothetical protein